MTWIVLKTVKREDGSLIIGCSVGPFKRLCDAVAFSAAAEIGSLGYENWLVKELLKPAPLINKK